MSKGISETEIVKSFKEAIGSAMVPHGKWRFTVTRFDGAVEQTPWIDNIVTKDGLNVIAANMIGPGTGANSAFRYIAIGTATAAGSLGSVQSGLGEVSRKIGATIASSNEVAILVATWAGNADSLTGITLGTAGMVNHASSGSGTFGSHVNSVSATLQDSDFLQVEMQVQIGSHAL
jgi:hypothetical protein